MHRLLSSFLGGWLVLVPVASPVLAQGISVNANVSANASVETRTLTPEQLACMRAAVDKREMALAAAFDAYASSVRSAYAKRRSDLAAAWTIADREQRRTAIRDAWKMFRDSKKSSNRTFRDARKAAWKQFHADAKACGVRPAEEPQGVDD